MKENCKNLSIVAANWWATQIRYSEGRNLKGLDYFTDSLASQIDKLVRVKGSLIISTYSSPSTLLDETAFKVGLDAKIPRGYEMKILFNNIFVYNPEGVLVSNY